jgi:tyrosine-specific transport protein
VIAFSVYALWQIVVFGSVPLEGKYGLIYALDRGIGATFCLSKVVHSVVVARAADLFALFAILTSFFGIGMGLVDFLADGLHIKRKGRGAVLLGLLVLIPSLYFAVSSERIFITALELSGGFGDTILNGILPVLMLLIGYHHFAPKLIKNVSIHIGYYILIGLFVLAFAFTAMVRMYTH